MDTLVDDLKSGHMRDAQPWDLAEAVEAITQQIDSGALSLDSARKAALVLIKSRHYDHARTIAQR